MTSGDQDNTPRGNAPIDVDAELLCTISGCNDAAIVCRFPSSGDARPLCRAHFVVTDIASILPKPTIGLIDRVEIDVPLHWLVTECEKYFATKIAVLIVRTPQLAPNTEEPVALTFLRDRTVVSEPPFAVEIAKHFARSYVGILEDTAEKCSILLLNRCAVKKMDQLEQYRRSFPNADVILSVARRVIEPYESPDCAFNLFDRFLERHAPEERVSDSAVQSISAITKSQFAEEMERGQRASNFMGKAIEAIKNSGQFAGPRLVQTIPARNAESDEKNKLPESLRRGERAHKIIDEAKRIRRMVVDSGMTVAEIEHNHPEYAIWPLVRARSAEDQELFRRPRQWDARVVGYALNLLAKDYGLSPATIRDDVKQYRAWLRSNPRC